MRTKKTAALILGVILICVAWFFKPLTVLENAFYDSTVSFAKQSAVCDSIVIVGIDAESIGSIGSWPWPRATIANLVDKVNSFSPRVIALDILFPRKPDDKTGNDSLANAFKNVKNLVLPFRVGVLRDDNVMQPSMVSADVLRQRFLMVTHAKDLENTMFFVGDRVDASDTMFTGFASRSGVMNVTTSKHDQKLREIVHVVKVGTEYYPSFGLCAVASYLGLSPEQFILDGKPAVKLGTIEMPLSNYAASTFVRFRGRPGTVTTIPAQSVLNGSVSPSSFKDKLVFIGVTDAGAGADFFITPTSSQFPGVELWATTAMDIVQRSWIHAANAIQTLFMLILALIIFPGCVLFFPKKQSLVALLTGLGCVFVSIATGVFFYAVHYTLWDPSLQCIAFVFMIVFMALQRGDAGFDGVPALSFDVPPQEDADMLSAPQEKDILKSLPNTDTAFYASRVMTNATSEFSQKNGDTFSGTSLQENSYSPPGMVSNSLPVDKTIALTPEQIAQCNELAGGRIVQLLGSGGMADVYKVWNPRIEMYRAVKVIKPGQSQGLLSRFETEIKILSKLQHANIVQFYTVGEWYSLPYIEMEYVPGASLEDVLKKTKIFSMQEVAAIGIVVCKALSYAHAKATALYGKTYNGVIHRDLKPGNILLSKSGRVKLTDFGIARPQDVSLHTMDSGSIVGTLPYLAPEQLSGSHEINCQVDIYALGVTLYELLFGVRAFPQKNVTDLVAAKSLGKYSPVTDIHISEPFMKIINKAMALNVTDRYLSAAAMESDLDKMIRTSKPASGYEILAGLVRRYTF